MNKRFAFSAGAIMGGMLNGILEKFDLRGQIAVEKRGTQLDQTSFRFGSFALRIDRRELMRDGKRVVVSARAVDMLIALVRADGEVISRQALLESAWSGRRMDESNVTHGISELRRVLGDSPVRPRVILTVPKRGYCLAARVAGETACGNKHRSPLLRPLLSKGAWRYIAIVLLLAGAGVLYPFAAERSRLVTLRSAGTQTMQQTFLTPEATGFPRGR
ncbi:MAG: transcriptional regulator [Bryobacterales bacterium]|nr:transcriptional regulator [Bryobacterales bacterium]